MSKSYNQQRLVLPPSEHDYTSKEPPKMVLPQNHPTQKSAQKQKKAEPKTALTPPTFNNIQSKPIQPAYQGPKYFLSDDTITVDDPKLHRIVAVRDIPSIGVHEGDEGGYIENEKFDGSLSVENMTGSLLEFANLGLGTYELEEVSAPSGYALSEDIYTVVIAPVGEGVYTVKITKKDAGTKVETEVLSKQLTFANQFENFGGINKMVATLAFEVEDMVAYSLPETGGSGVYIYIIGGILLMFAGVLLLYKNKKIIK